MSTVLERPRPKSFKESLKNERSLAREGIFFHRVAHDLKVAAANQGYHLQLMRSDVDDAGVDVVADWGTGTRRLQLKTIMKGSSTRSWKIQSSLLKPKAEEDSTHQISEWQYYHPFGVNGAVILAEIDWREHLPAIKYLFCDLFVLMLKRDGIIGGRNSRAARRVLSEVALKKSAMKVVVPLSCFVMPSSMKDLLFMAQMPVRARWSWMQQFFRCYSPKRLAEREPPRQISVAMLDEFYSMGSDYVEHKFFPAST